MKIPHYKLLLIALLIVGCEETTDSDTCSNCISGNVTGSDGNPLESGSCFNMDRGNVWRYS